VTAFDGSAFMGVVADDGVLGCRGCISSGGSGYG
jgi:hypothetical protein